MSTIVSRGLTFTVVVAAALLGARSADATVYNIHINGNCSTNWGDGKGSSGLGQWHGEVSVNAFVDQRESLAVATQQLKGVLDQHCVADGDSCWLFGYSAGDAVIGQTLERFGDAWNIDAVVIAAGAGGGSAMASNLAGALLCNYSAGLQPSIVRNAYDHDDTAGNLVYRLGGRKGRPEIALACAATTVVSWLTFGLVDRSCLKGPHDGLVAYHSSGAYRDTEVHNDFWNSGAHFNNHQSLKVAGPGDEGEDLDHYEMKGLGVCLLGGVPGVAATLPACRAHLTGNGG